MFFASRTTIPVSSYRLSAPSPKNNVENGLLGRIDFLFRTTNPICGPTLYLGERSESVLKVFGDGDCQIDADGCAMCLQASLGHEFWLKVQDSISCRQCGTQLSNIHFGSRYKPPLHAARGQTALKHSIGSRYKTPFHGARLPVRAFCEATTPALTFREQALRLHTRKHCKTLVRRLQARGFPVRHHALRRS